jgi:hypothetical protein
MIQININNQVGGMMPGMMQNPNIVPHPVRKDGGNNIQQPFFCKEFFFIILNSQVLTMKDCQLNGNYIKFFYLFCK